MSRTSRELVAKVLNMFKNWMQIFFPKYFARLSCDGRPTFVRMSRTCCREIYNAKVSRPSYECRASVARRSLDSLETTCEKLATIWREIKLSDICTNVVRHSHECRATVVRMKTKIIYIRGNVVRHSHECRATVLR